MEIAREWLREQWPFLSLAIASTTLIHKPGYGTLGVDRYWRLYYDPPEEWTTVQLGGVIAHEIAGHLMREHAQRAAAAGVSTNVDAKLWNWATDAKINAWLKGCGIPLPASGIYPETLGFPPALLTEEDVYAWLKENVEIIEIDAAGCGGGSGVTNIPEPFEEGEPSEGKPGLMPVDAASILRETAEEIQRQLATQGRGSVPGEWVRWAEERLRAAVVPWPRALSALVRRWATTRRGRRDYSYAKIHRRQSVTPWWIRPAPVEPEFSLGAVIDTSGSMGADDLMGALSELDGACKAAGVPVKAYACDAEAHALGSVSTARSLVDKLVGGGGTDMGVGIEAALKARPRPDAIIVLTDGETPWPPEPPVPVGVVLLREAETPPWAIRLEAFRGKEQQ